MRMRRRSLTSLLRPVRVPLGTGMRAGTEAERDYRNQAKAIVRALGYFPASWVRSKPV